MDMNHFWFDSYTETIIKHERKEKKTKNKNKLIRVKKITTKRKYI